MRRPSLPASRPDAHGRPFASFVEAISQLLEGRPPESAVRAEGTQLLGELVSRDDWLESPWDRPDPQRYRQNLLYGEAGGFCVVSFVWGPGQSTPVHDHRTWGLIGMLRGAEEATSYAYSAERGLQEDADPVRLRPGDVDAVSPAIGDIHRVRNALADRPSVSIHVYGANIGTTERCVYPGGAETAPFVSGYSNATLPNPWGPVAR